MSTKSAASTVNPDADTTVDIGTAVRELEDPKTRRRARDILVQAAAGQLRAHGRIIDTTLDGSVDHIVGEVHPDVLAALNEGLFGSPLPPGDVKEYYFRAAKVIRGQLLARLDHLLAGTAAGLARNKLAQWRHLHAAADRLPDKSLAVYDVMFYGNRPKEQVAAILSLKHVEFDTIFDGPITTRLKPLLETARGRVTS